MTRRETPPGRIRARLDSLADAILARAHAHPAEPFERLRRAWAGSHQGGGLKRLSPVAICVLVALAAFVSTLPGAPGTTGSPGAAHAVALAGEASPSALSSPALGTQESGPADPYPGDGSLQSVLRRPPEADARALMQKYKVQAGDTLGSIAGKFGLSATTIYWANRSAIPDPQLLRPGQTLTIPPIDGLVIVVGANQTLDSIATKYGVASQDIVDANDLSNSAVVLGQALIVPGAVTPPVPVVRAAKTTKTSSAGSIGRLVWPVPGQKLITQPFGCTGNPSEPPYGKCAHFHDAIDIGAPEGATVVAAAAGTVIYAGWKDAGSDGYGGGLVVWISHDGKLYTTYNHLSEEFVKVGQSVSAGQRIGSVGMTGNATGPHLHFEVWVCYPWTGSTIGCARNPLNYTR